MPFNLLLIPLLGGYIFVRFWNYSKIHILRADKDRILIRASLAGFFSLIPAFFISIFVPLWFPCSTQHYCLYSWWAENIKFEYAGVSLIAFVISSTTWRFLNIFCTDEKAIDKAIKEDGDPLEMAFKRSSDMSMPIAITLANEKVYIGIVTHQFNPATPTNNISILPFQSGFRDPVTKRMNLRIDYVRIWGKMIKRLDCLARQIAKLQGILDTQNDGLTPDQKVRLTEMLGARINIWDDIEARSSQFEVTLPVSQITSVFYYDEVTYQEYFRSNDDHESSVPPANTLRPPIGRERFIGPQMESFSEPAED